MPVEAQPVAAVVDTTGAPGYLSIRDLRKEFDGFVAVDDVNRTCARARSLPCSVAPAVVNRPCCAVWADAHQGSITVDGQRTDALPPYQRPVNMMFQSYALFPHMTVEQNIAFGLKQDGRARTRSASASARCSTVQMGHLGKRKPHQLSGGQQQRVALARSLAKGPKLLLLDEPMGALDKLRSQMQLELVSIIESSGVTCVMVTHDRKKR